MDISSTIEIKNLQSGDSRVKLGVAQQALYFMVDEEPNNLT